MDFMVPTWLNQAFMEKVLRKSEADNSLQVINIFSKPATNKGDNYGSDMVRVNIEYSRNHSKITEKKSVVIKIAPVTEGPRKEMIMTSGIFYTEILMMTHTLEKMNNLLKPKHRLSAKSLYVQKDDPPLLVLEDLVSLGFRLADRLSGLDLDHCILAIHGLARFHAASVAVFEKEPELKEMYTKGMFNIQYPEEMSRFFIMSCKTLAKEMASWPELKKYSEKIIKFAERIYEVGIETCKLDENEFNVINHGDFWVNNMMFKYNNDGKPIDHIFVDFQICIYRSPAIDLLYFLSTSPSEDVIENKRHVLLNEYLDTLSTTMKQLNCKTQPPTMEELKAAMRRRAAYGMIASFTVLPVVLCKKDDIKNIDEMFGTDNNFINPSYKNETYRKMIERRIPIYDELGLLDF